MDLEDLMLLAGTAGSGVTILGFFQNKIALIAIGVATVGIVTLSLLAA